MAGRGKGEETVRIMIATPLEEELVREIQDVDPRVEVLYEADLLPPPRYPSDHKGEPDFYRSADDERRWKEMLGDAEILFGAPGESTPGLLDAIRRGFSLRWLQATNAGVGEQVRAADLAREELDRVMITSASGVHATPLAEFSIFGLLAFAKDLPRLLRDKENKRWDHYPMQELREQTLLVVGLGKVGLEVARLARSFGMHTIGTKRRPGGEFSNVDEIYASGHLKELVPRADAVVVTLPLTEETEGMVDRKAIELMKPGCVLVNVGRGGVVDEEALIEALKDNKLRGAALDVFREEPLHEDSPLWELPNVLISPHTAALVAAENKRIVRLFTENLRRYLGGEPLLNQVDPEMFY